MPLELLLFVFVPLPQYATKHCWELDRERSRVRRPKSASRVTYLGEQLALGSLGPLKVFSLEQLAKCVQLCTAASTSM